MLQPRHCIITASCPIRSSFGRISSPHGAMATQLSQVILVAHRPPAWSALLGHHPFLALFDLCSAYAATIFFFAPPNTLEHSFAQSWLSFVYPLSLRAVHAAIPPFVTLHIFVLVAPTCVVARLLRITRTGFAPAPLCPAPPCHAMPCLALPCLDRSSSADLCLTSCTYTHTLFASMND